MVFAVFAGVFCDDVVEKCCGYFVVRSSTGVVLCSTE